MLWFWYAVFSGFCSSLVSPIRKELSSRLSPITILWMPGLLAIPVYLFFIFWFGLPSLNGDFLWLLMGTILLEIVGNLLLIYALKIEDLSIVVPMLSLGPAFSYFINIVFLNSPFNTNGLIGVILIVFGSILAHAKINKKGINIKFSLGSTLALLVALIWSFGSVGFVVGIRSSSILGFVSAVNLIITVVLMLVDIVILGTKFPKKEIFKDTNLWLTSLSFFTWVGEFNSVALVSQPAYVGAVRRMDTLLNIVYGKFIWNEDRFYQKLIAGCFMIAGVLLIIFLPTV
jgi:drug/metabolite transporter (DMT)-like permease